MPRRRFADSADLIFHVINRGVRRARLFDNPGDYRAFLDLMREAHRRIPIRILAYCIMPNHFHFVLWPGSSEELREFMHWFTLTHSKPWHAFRGSVGTGPVYQGRFKAFPVQTETHFLTVCRYVERNPLRAGLVSQAEDWAWSSLFQRCRNRTTVPLERWPILPPDDWLAIVNGAEPAEQVGAVREALRKGVPLGDKEWRTTTAARLGIPAEIQRAGRPKKTTPGVVFQPLLTD